MRGASHRQIAIVTPLAALPLLMPRPGGEPSDRPRRRTRSDLGAMLVCSLVMMSLVRPTGEMMNWLTVCTTCSIFRRPRI